MITIRYWLDGVGVCTTQHADVQSAAHQVALVRRYADMDLISVTATPRLVGAVALACAVR